MKFSLCSRQTFVGDRTRAFLLYLNIKSLEDVWRHYW